MARFFSPFTLDIFFYSAFAGAKPRNTQTGLEPLRRTEMVHSEHTWIVVVWAGCEKKPGGRTMELRETEMTNQ